MHSQRYGQMVFTSGRLCASGPTMWEAVAHMPTHAGEHRRIAATGVRSIRRNSNRSKHSIDAVMNLLRPSCQTTLVDMMERGVVSTGGARAGGRTTAAGNERKRQLAAHVRIGTDVRCAAGAETVAAPSSWRRRLDEHPTRQ